MSDYTIILPSKPRIVSEEETKGVYEIDNLYPGYGHTLGNSLRRIILSSLPGAAITSIKIDGVSHEFSVVDGIKEDVINIILALKKVRFKMITDEPQTATISAKGVKVVTAGDIKAGGQMEVLNPDLHIAELTDKSASLNIEIQVEKGLGFVSKDIIQKGKVDIGVIAMDAIFTPIRRVSYEVENMRVGDKTNHNRLRISIETDGTVAPREALDSSISIMLEQLQAMLDLKSAPVTAAHQTEAPIEAGIPAVDTEEKGEDMTDIMKTRTDSLDLSTRTLNALTAANIRTLGGLAKKKEDDLLELDGIGDKGIQEIKKVLASFGLSLK